MKYVLPVGLAIAAGWLATASAPAAILEDFQFNDPDGTALNAAANAVNPGNQWVHDTDHAATIQMQGGSLRILKSNTDFVTEGLQVADAASGTRWMVAEFSGWAVLGSAPDGNNVEEIRFGFAATADLVPPPSSAILAEMMIARNHGASQFQISGSALGAGGTGIAPASIDFVQPEPFVMAMEVNQDENTYTIYYKDGAAPFVKLGTGDLEPTRDILITRFTINNFWGYEPSEFAALDRFYISDAAPEGIPEPASAATLLLATAALAPSARRGRSSG